MIADTIDCFSFSTFYEEIEACVLAMEAELS